MAKEPDDHFTALSDINRLGLRVADHIQAMLAYWDADQVCRFANNAYLEWFGKGRDEMVNKITLKELLGPLYEKNLPYISAVLKGEIQQFERDITVPGGETRSSIANYYPDIINGVVKGFFVHVSDVTQIKKLEKELAFSEKKFRDLLESASDATVIIKQTGEIEIVNLQTERLFGYQRNDLFGKKIEMILPERFWNIGPDERSGFFQNPEGFPEKEDQELFGLKKNGEEFPVEISISSIQLQDGLYVSAAIRDVTRRKQQEKEINEQAMIISSATDAILSNTVEGTILTWNKGAEQMFGYTLEEIKGRHISLLFPPELLEEETLLISKILNGQSIQQYETIRLKKDGSEVNASLTMSPILDKNGSIIKISKIIRDITSQKKAERELMQSNERSKIFIDQAPHAIAMFDSKMCYLAASKRWVSDYNLEGMAIIGRSHYDIFPEIGDDWKKIHQECLHGEINQCDEARFERADGSVQWLTWDIRPWYLSEGYIGGILMYTADVTASKERDEEKKKIEAILDKTNEVARIGTWEVDTKNSRVTWSRITREIHEVPIGYEPKLGEAILFFKEGSSRTRIENVFEEAISTGTTYDIEVELITAKGKEIWVRVIGQTEFSGGICTRLYGVFQDIDEVKRSRDALYRLNNDLTSILNSSHVSIISTDLDGTITHFNRGAELLLQYDANEVVGKCNPSVFHVEEDLISRGIELSALYGQPINHFDVFVEVAKRERFESREWTYVRKDGSKFPVQLVVTAIRDMEGVITGYLGIATDISEIKNAAQEKQSLLEIATDQNERLKNFAYIVSHNLRSHMGNIDMTVSLFVDENQQMADNEMILLLQMAITNLKDTIANLNEVVLMNTSFNEKLIPIDLALAINTAIQTVFQLARDASVSIINNVAGDIRILGFPAYIESVLLNFITNGIKYHSPERKGEVRFSAIRAGKYIVLKIQDNGLGINLKQHGSKLFGMYKTFHGNKDARGIGLFITKNQIETMGGRIEVESEVNEGTTFTLYLKNEKS
ncbi:MAG: PAS domain S-box protein [Dyadobacter sp.]|uniref:PAS domain-containing sensor histidine kinase n=1 Tax=Dyadobacter sp. TaxID=1914288 RepID=UPI003265FD4D